ncbi:MAG: M81 family metallopeptidase [Clostridia bacterium]|nr:M81 family metallopeptidase [Clostridia bacterium]
MDIIIASYQCESNTLATHHPGKEDFEYAAGDAVSRKLAVTELFEREGFTVIPSIYADALPSGTVEQDIHAYYSEQILDTVRANPDAHGVFIFFHGSMEVDGIGSGELDILKKIRKILKNKSALIAISLDAHANITDELCDYADIISGFKTIPHVDQAECQRRSAEALCYCLKNSVKPYSYMQRVPFLLKNDTVQTGYEPLKSLIEETKRLESTEDILCANLFLGHCWIDAPNTSASTLVTALKPEVARDVAKELAVKLWNTRRDYKFTVEAEEPEECVKRAIEGKERRIFITDSGDNTTAGAEGDTTGILELLLAEKPEKKVCVAGITDFDTVDGLWSCADGAQVELKKLGVSGVVKAHGKVLGWTGECLGRSLAVTVGNIDVIFTDLRSSYTRKESFDAANVDLLAYEIVVVKLGYLFTALKPYADRELFALSEGSSCVELKKLGLKRILRPMFPLDEFEFDPYK